MDRLGADNRFQLGVALDSRMRAPDRAIVPRFGAERGEPVPGLTVLIPPPLQEPGTP
ncbi:hypothetical protein [Streptomyces sp. NPDC057403]|uniref:hypothetical protein n=1 Tax=Streptomyces sp. NPDC057403 TaxID=3346119 RepID=UPI00367BEC91